MEAITIEQAEEMTAFDTKVYEWGYPKLTYVDIHIQDFDEKGVVYDTKTYLLKQ